MNIKTTIYKFIVKNPFRFAKWQRELPGHYYSPIASRKEFQKIKHSLYAFRKHYPGVDLQLEKQMILFEAMVSFFQNNSLPTNNRFKADNSFFYNGDAMALYFFINKLKPRQIIEIGSGHSSALMLDANEQMAESDRLKLTFIEPYPKRLKTQLKDSDYKTSLIIEKGVQFTDRSIFESLKAGDILFIDSSHVSKVGSDLNYILFEIIPILPKGVIIHFHDIFFNFEYPEKWIMEGRNWNEVYLLRAFLQFNNSFKVLFFNSYINEYLKQTMESKLPGFKNDFVGSLWIEKTE